MPWSLPRMGGRSTGRPEEGSGIQATLRGWRGKCDRRGRVSSQFYHIYVRACACDAMCATPCMRVTPCV